MAETNGDSLRSVGDDAGSRALTSAFSQTLLAILFGLTFETVLEKGLRLEVEHAYWDELLDHFLSEPSKHVFGFLQLFAFVATLCRFYGGAHRFYQEQMQEDTRLGSTLHDALWMVFLFVGFYIAALLVETHGLFLLAVTVFHGIDFLWFWFSGAIGHHKPHVEKVVRAYIVYDLVTVVAALLAALAYCWFDFESIHFQWISALILIPMFFIDVFGPTRDWYFNPRAWRRKYV